MDTMVIVIEYFVQEIQQTRLWIGLVMLIIHCIFQKTISQKIGHEPNESYLRLNDGSLAIQKKTRRARFIRKSLVNGSVSYKWGKTCISR